MVTVYIPPQNAWNREWFQENALCFSVELFLQRVIVYQYSLLTRGINSSDISVKTNRAMLSKIFQNTSRLFSSPPKKYLVANSQKYVFKEAIIHFAVSFVGSMYIVRKCYLCKIFIDLWRSFSRTSLSLLTGWRRRKINFRGRFRILRTSRPRLSIKVKGIRYRIHLGRKLMKIRYGGKYREVISRGKLPYLKIGKTLYRIYIRGRYWNIRRGRRLLRLPRVARYYFMRKWRQAKCSGKMLFIRYMRRWFRVLRQKGYTIRYRGRKLRVKRTRKGYKVRFGGRYGKARRGKMETKLKNYLSIHQTP